MSWFVELVEQFQVHKLYNARKSTKISHQILALKMEEIMDLSRILLAVKVFLHFMLTAFTSYINSM